MIESLTQEQEKQIEVYTQKGLSVGNSTEPADFDRAEKAILELYKFCGFEHPEKVYRVDSPLAAQNLLKELTGEDIFHPTHGYGYGQHESFWIYYYNYFKEVLDIKYDAKAEEGLRIMTEITESCGFYYMFDEALVICDRPEIISLNDDNLIHCEDGPAIKYRDGLSVYAINGHTIPDWVIEQPELITVDKIKTEVNAETKRIMMEIYGISEYLMDIKAKVIDVDPGLGLEGSAMRTLIEDDGGQKWLIGSDGSTKRIYHMPVQNHVKTCAEAHQSISGIDESKLIAES